MKSRGARLTPWHTEPAGEGAVCDGTHCGGPMPTVEVWSDRGRDRVVTLTEAAYMVGSDAEADIAVSDATVSRAHAVLERVGTTWLVRDAGSRNGTRVGGERLTGQCRLRNGD